jgi:ATP-dependent DNA ligase
LEKIIRLTIPSNLENTGEDIRLQYKYDSIIQKYIEENMGINKQLILDNKGDLANLVMNNFKRKKGLADYSLTVQSVHEVKEQMINTIGLDSQDEKLSIIKELFEQSYEKLEAFYITRIFLNRMKLGFGQKGVVNSLKLIEETVSKEDYKALTEVLQNVFQHNLILKKGKLSPGNLVELMLCKSEGSLEDLRETLLKSKNDFLCETKYDGERTQVKY